MILKNGITLHGRIRKYTDTDIFLEDMIARRHTIRLTDVEEIVLDQESPY
jgi:hypothetical protein